MNDFKTLSEINKPKALEELKEMGVACLGSASPVDDGWGDDDDFSTNTSEESSSTDDWDDWDNA